MKKQSRYSEGLMITAKCPLCSYQYVAPCGFADAADKAVAGHMKDCPGIKALLDGMESRGLVITSEKQGEKK